MLTRYSIAALATLILAATMPSANASEFSLTSNFNGTDLCSGETCNVVWYSAHLTGLPDVAGTLLFSGQTVTHEDPSIQTFDIPDALISFENGTGEHVSVYNAALNRWETTIYLGSSASKPFISGWAGSPSVELSGSNPVTWSGEVMASASLVGESFNWQWNAAAYTDFDSDLSILEVAAVSGHDCATGEGEGNVQSGTPCSFTEFVTGGARGGGGSNFTGSNSGTGTFTPTVVPVPAAAWLFASGILALGGLARRKG